MIKKVKKGVSRKAAALIPKMDRVLSAIGKLPAAERRRFINAISQVSDLGATNPKLGNRDTRRSALPATPATSMAGQLAAGEEDYFRTPRNARGQYKEEPEASINPARVTLSVRMRSNPVKGLTFERLVNYLDQWSLGFFRGAGMAWDKMERRDYQLQIVRPKRLKSVARHGYDVLIPADLDEKFAALAQQQKDFLSAFYGNCTATTAINPDEEGGFSLLVRQMMDAQGKYYSCHELVWQPDFDGQGNLTAKFIHCPIWWFEGTRGKLRYLPSEFQIYGNEMLPGDWLVTCGDGIMEACSVIYLFKYGPLKSWLAFLDKFGMPGIHGKTDAVKGSPEWDDFVSAVQSFAEDWAAVSNRNADISLVEAAKGGGDGGYDKIVEKMDRAITQLWRGADLGTSSSAHGTGASLQEDESEILETDDAKLIEETLTLKVSRFALAWKFGPDTPQLAYLKLRTTPRRNIQDDLAVDTFLAQFKDKDGKGILGTEATLERYSRPVVKAGDDTLDPPATAKPAAAVPPGKADKNAEFANSAANGAPPEKLQTQFAADVAVDLSPIVQAALDESAAIAQITDPELKKQKIIALLAKLDALTADALLAPQSADSLAAVIIAGLNTKSMT